MPVSLNEPVSGLQRLAEAIIAGNKLLSKAAHMEDPFRRHACAMISCYAGYVITKVRQRKPFNPMLGETYEFVSDEFRFIGEKVAHNPD